MFYIMGFHVLILKLSQCKRKVISPRSLRSKVDDDLDDMIKDICLDDGPDVVPSSNSKTKVMICC